MEMIDKHDLEVDRTYQRDLSDYRSVSMARDWSWIACGVIVVAERNGKRYVVDGQHRVNAARKRSDITDLPCIVFRSNGIEEEARGFLVTQTARNAVTSVDKFRAMLAINDPHAMMVNELVESCGRVISKASGPNTCQCASAMIAAAREDSAALRRIWPIIAHICEGKAMVDIIIKAFMHIERRMPDGQSLADPSWARRMMRLDCDEIVLAARRAQALDGSSGPAVWSSGIIKLINKGHRNRLELRK